MKVDLKEHLMMVLPSSEGLIAPISQVFKSIELKKGDYLVLKGQVCSQAVFIEKGVMRNFYLDREGNDITTYLVCEGWFNTSYTSFLEQVPSIESIQAVSDCQLKAIDFETFSLLKANSKNFSEMTDKLIIRGLECKDERLQAYQTRNAVTRYRELLEKQPSIIQHTPLQYVASYLGISRETLSRIRNQKDN